MGREDQDDNEGFVDSNLELLHTQVYYLVKLLCQVYRYVFYWAFVGTLLIFPLFGGASAGPCFKCLHHLGFCGAKTNYWNTKPCDEGTKFVKWDYMPLAMEFYSSVKFVWVMNLWQIWQATLGFFALPNDPGDVVNPLIDNLITLLCAILLTRYSIIKRAMLFLNCLFFWNIIVSLSLEVWVKCIT